MRPLPPSLQPHKCVVVAQVIVSRMRYIAEQTGKPVRFVGLSTALANAQVSSNHPPAANTAFRGPPFTHSRSLAPHPFCCT